MIGKNLLWVAEQHAHGVQVMLNMYAAWLKGATEGGLESIQKAMQSEGARAAAHGGGAELAPCTAQPEPRPEEAPEFDSRLAVREWALGSKCRKSLRKYL